MNTVLVSRSASMHADKIVLLNIVPSTSAIRSSLIGPLQLVIHVVQNRHGGEQQTHRGKKNKELTSWFTINKSVPLLVCSQCFSCSPAWRALTTWKFTFIHEQCSLKHKRNDSIWYELAVLVPVRSILLPAPDIVAERAVDQKDEHEEEVEIR